MHEVHCVAESLQFKHGDWQLTQTPFADKYVAAGQFETHPPLYKYPVLQLLQFVKFMQEEQF